MIYEWDENKHGSNQAKHGLDFALARVFEWESAFIQKDERRHYGEVRFKALGFIDGRIHSLVFTRRNGIIRVIGLRKANARERKAYEKNRQK